MSLGSIGLGIVGFAVSAIGSIAQAAGAEPSGLLQYGALGLCALMIIMQGYERRQMVRDIGRKDDAIERKDKAFQDIFRECIQSMDRVSTAIEKCQKNAS